ncbi:MAG TPA: serine protease [Planctomycetaceae bacterium]|nr:serine protease [Planctomycetaceae bacterium]
MMRWLFGGLATLMLSGTAFAQVGTVGPPATAVRRSDQDLARFSPEERTAIRVYERVNRSVVNISTRSLPRDAFLVFDQAVEGAGSGSVLDLQGHILTNHHVINGADEIRVTLYDGSSFPAAVVGSDPPNDIAVLKIDAPETSLIPVAAGESSDLRVGQRIYAIGNPFGLERTMTEGIISSLNRTLPVRGTERTMKSIIQIDAALNRGNSGGPLIDSRGEVVGMNTAIASSVGENSGVGFAIPISTIRRVVPQLIERGKVVRADLGIERTWSAPDGLGIAILVPGGAAEKAGLRGVRVVVRQRRQGPFIYQTPVLDFDSADRILAIDGRRVANFDELLTAVESHQPGEEAVVTILREGAALDVPITLGQER